ncbi:hypothetical protein KAW50_03680 [candidate division WOR-3 bacterium]|nr:hypothetical protein [candidate division WOR-3 bacterium]
MSRDLTKTFQKDNTAYFECYYRDMQSFKKDPVNPTYVILDIRGNVVTSGIPSKKATGIFYFFWTPTSEGDYLLIFGGSVSGYSVKLRRKFKVVRTSWKGEFSSSSSSSSSSSFSSCSSSCSSS